jgi:hypothetical protein
MFPRHESRLRACVKWAARGVARLKPFAVHQNPQPRTNTAIGTDRMKPRLQKREGGLRGLTLAQFCRDDRITNCGGRFSQNIFRLLAARFAALATLRGPGRGVFSENL